MSSLRSLAPPGIVLPPVKTGPQVLPSESETYTYQLSTKFGNALLVFLVVVCFVWVILYVFNPKMVQGRYVVADGAGNTRTLPDAARCFVGSIIGGLILVVLWWLYRTCQ